MVYPLAAERQCETTFIRLPRPSGRNPDLIELNSEPVFAGWAPLRGGAAKMPMSLATTSSPLFHAVFSRMHGRPFPSPMPVQDECQTNDLCPTPSIPSASCGIPRGYPGDPLCGGLV